MKLKQLLKCNSDEFSASCDFTCVILNQIPRVKASLVHRYILDAQGI